MTPDSELLATFARTNSEDAFAELVRRHVNLVYSAAILQVGGDAHLAQDAAQSVFTDLARKAGSLVRRETLSGWLYTSAHFAAAKLVRTETHRRDREEHFMRELTNQSSASVSPAAPTPKLEWEQLRPLLDDAMHELKEADRTAILLRYFENRPFAEVGAQLGLNENAARMRVERALEKLRATLSQRGLAITVALATVISAQAVQVAPVGLAVAISTAALAGTAATTSSLIATTKTIAMTTLQKTLVTATVAVLVGAGIYEVRQTEQLRDQVQTLQQQQVPLAEQVQVLQKERDYATNRLSELGNELAKANKNNLELMKLRASATRFQTATKVENDPAFQKASEWMTKEIKLRQQFEEHPDQWIPEMKYLSSEEWLDQARKADLETATGMRCALSNVRSMATFNFAGKITQALRGYMAAHNEQLPDSTAQLAPYFLTFNKPVRDAESVLSRYEMLNGEQKSNPLYQDAVIILSQKYLVDHIDNAVLIGTSRTSSLPKPSYPPKLPEDLNSIIKAYQDANHYGFLSIYDLEPFATTSEQKAALNKFISSATQPR